MRVRTCIKYCMVIVANGSNVCFVLVPESRSSGAIRSESKSGLVVAGYVDMSIPFAAGGLYSTTEDLLVGSRASRHTLATSRGRRPVNSYISASGLGRYLQNGGEVLTLTTRASRYVRVLKNVVQM